MKSAMVRWPKRLLFAILSALIAVVVCAIAFSLVIGGAFPGLDVFAFILEASAPGFAVGLPFVFLIKNVSGARFALLLLIGACIGPFVLFWEMYFSVGERVRCCESMSVFLVELRYATDIVSKFFCSALISVLTTLIFLVLLRRALEQSSGEGGSGAEASAGSTLHLRS